MWRILITLLAVTGAVAAGKTTFGQAPREAYGPFDAIAEGSRNNELRRLSLIGAQLDTVDALRELRVGQPRGLWGPDVAAVYAYGRRGILGLRPRGYVVVRRAPVVNRRTYGVEGSPPGFSYGSYTNDPYSQSARQPIGHQSLQTGPNRWEYRPLYAADDGRLDEIHGQIEGDLRPGGDAFPTDGGDMIGSDTRGAGGRAAASGPEELPIPRDQAVAQEARPPVPRRGQARDIARSAAFAGERNDAASRRQAGDANLRNLRPPPPPRPDPLAQPRIAPEKRAPATDDAELRGPLLQNPSTGTREF
jgi:hypothetical protein